MKHVEVKEMLNEVLAKFGKSLSDLSEEGAKELVTKAADKINQPKPNKSKFIPKPEKRRGF